MKKLILFTMTVSLLFLGVLGFSYFKVSKSEQTKPKYNIDKIVIPVQKDFDIDINLYQYYDMLLIKEMAKENNIKVETKQYNTLDDIFIALKDGNVDVTTGIYRITDPELVKTYSYYTGALYANDDHGQVIEVAPIESYSFVTTKKNKELYKFFNEMIVKYKESGKLEQLQKKYLGKFNK